MGRIRKPTAIYDFINAAVSTTYITKQQFREFIHLAANGTSMVYAVGSKFARDCELDSDLKEIRRMAWDGPCILVQRKLIVGKDEFLYEYIAVKSSRRREHLRPSFWSFDGQIVDGELKPKKMPTKRDMENAW
jgi:hypothetical protein